MTVSPRAHYGKRARKVRFLNFVIAKWRHAPFFAVVAPTISWLGAME